MSTYTVEMRRCDLTGEEAPADSGKVEAVPFSLDGADYDIDLVPAHAEALREVFAEYIRHGRRLGRVSSSSSSATRVAPARQRATSSRQTKPDPEQAKAIRRWAKAVGYTVSDRGRIPGPVAEHYAEAKGQTAGVTPR